MAVVIGSERNIKVTSEDNSTKSQGPAFHCSPADQVGDYIGLDQEGATYDQIFSFILAFWLASGLQGT